LAGLWGRKKKEESPKKGATKKGAYHKGREKDLVWVESVGRAAALF